jgi:hypothetical protein
MDDAAQAMLGNGAHVARAEHAFEQQDWLADAGLAQGDGVFAFEQGKTVGLAAQGLDGAPLAVAVGIGLDDRPGARTRRQLLGQPVIVQDGRGAMRARMGREVFIRPVPSACLWRTR